MAQKKTLRSPTGGAGLVRYDEKEESFIKLEPKQVLYLIVGILVLEILLLFVQV